MLCDGEIVLHIDGCQYATQTLSTHLVTPNISHSINLKVLLNLKNYVEAYKTCERINARSGWLEFGEQAIADLEPDIALRAYRHIGDAAMVAALENMSYIEDVPMLTGFCCLLLGKYEEAKDYFLRGIYIKEALEICRDLLKWEQALLLAHKYEPDEVLFIAREYAQQLEFT